MSTMEQHLRTVALAAGCACFGLDGWAATAAEYAVRWNPALGGPQTPEEVVVLLGVKDKTPKKFEVRYFRTGQPVGLPTSVDVIARERKEGSSFEASYKLRAGHAIPALACPLTGGIWEDELDITWVPAQAAAASATKGKVLELRKRYSRTCSVANQLLKVVPAGFDVKEPPVDCLSVVTRYKHKVAKKEPTGLRHELKVEQWQLPKKEQLLEVSLKVAVDSVERQREFFTGVVEPLMAKKAIPTEESKTQMGKCM